MFSLITTIIANSGIWGVFALMLLENLLPVIPSELILPLAGYQAAKGQFEPVLAIIMATAGSSIGGFSWYMVGRWYGLGRLQALADKHGRWLPFTSREISKANAWFQRWGPLTVCVGRALPGVRGVICIPAGIAHMPAPRFLLWSTIGAFAWSDLLISSGYALQAHYDSIQRWLNPVVDGLLICGLALYLLRVVRFRKSTDVQDSDRSL